MKIKGNASRAGRIFDSSISALDSSAPAAQFLYDTGFFQSKKPGAAISQR
jgi:hypothetical protein